MIQEIIALSVFGGAVIYSLITLILLLIPAKNKSLQSCGGSSCGCNEKKENDLIKYKANRYKSVIIKRLK